MQSNHSDVVRLGRREALALLARLGVGGAALMGMGIAGCGGGGDSARVTVRRTGRFYSNDAFAIVGDLGFNIGRTYVVLENGIPLELGWELPENALIGLPDQAFDDPGIYFMALPPEADATPFKWMAFSDWTNGHSPAGIGDAPHVHPVFCIAPPGVPQDGNPDEKMPVLNDDEIPEGYVLGATIPGVGETTAPGIGEAFEYPAAPQLQPGWNTTAQNWFFYKGHLNGIGMGASYDFLNKKLTNVLPIAQPKLYPRPGWYPTKNITRWDESRKVHVFALADFVQATNYL